MRCKDTKANKLSLSTTDRKWIKRFFFFQTLPYCHDKESLGASNDAFTREKNICWKGNSLHLLYPTKLSRDTMNIKWWGMVSCPSAHLLSLHPFLHLHLTSTNIKLFKTETGCFICLLSKACLPTSPFLMTHRKLSNSLFSLEVIWFLHLNAYSARCIQVISQFDWIGWIADVEDNKEREKTVWPELSWERLDHSILSHLIISSCNVFLFINVFIIVSIVLLR